MMLIIQQIGGNVMGKRSSLSTAQRQEVVLKLLRREEPGAALARRYSISEASLYRWRDEFLAAGKAALANGRGSGEGQSKRIQELEREIVDRDQVIGEYTIANRILKKLTEGSL